MGGEEHRCLWRRYREQARSHMGFGLTARFVFTQVPCGSEPARDDVGPVTSLPTDSAPTDS
ncbi:protein of unknown function [Pseudomonas mediterranea]